MGRAPCCEMMGLKKGPWTPEEDKILVSYIQIYGHGNWRALPKQAGLLRCGKSCRLRWINYLRPDITRGNFSNEEEETIVKLHQMLGNRYVKFNTYRTLKGWSTIAARLPGRTDNEIKNYWHSHLKKRFQQDRGNPVEHRRKTPRSAIVNSTSSSQLENFEVHQSKCHSPSDKAPIFQEASSQEVFNGFDGKNDMEEFWYELLVKAGNSREVLESWGQFG